MQGHINPLLAEGAELARRGWRVSISSPARAENYITSYIAKQRTAGQRGAEQMQFVNGGLCRDETAHFFDKVLYSVAENSDFGSGTRASCMCRGAGAHVCDASMRRIAAHFPVASDDVSLHVQSARHVAPRTTEAARHHGSHALCAELWYQPSFVQVVDAATYLGADLAREFNVPFCACTCCSVTHLLRVRACAVMNNADLVYLLPEYAIPACDYVPGALSPA